MLKPIFSHSPYVSSKRIWSQIHLSKDYMIRKKTYCFTTKNRYQSSFTKKQKGNVWSFLKNPFPLSEQLLSLRSTGSNTLIHQSSGPLNYILQGTHCLAAAPMDKLFFSQNHENMASQLKHKPWLDDHFHDFIMFHHFQMIFWWLISEYFCWTSIHSTVCFKILAWRGSKIISLLNLQGCKLQKRWVCRWNLASFQGFQVGKGWGSENP